MRDEASGRRVARIVEVEAYGGPDDRASHARFTSQGRNRVMSGPAGIAYVYLVYGMYDCLNVVVGPAGPSGEAGVKRQSAAGPATGTATSTSTSRAEVSLLNSST